jgi:DNA invertase Pin-like site-specific DNA recombinase
VAADNPHAAELTVDILGAAADEARRTAERTRAAIAVKKTHGAVLGRPANFAQRDRRRSARWPHQPGQRDWTARHLP